MRLSSSAWLTEIVKQRQTASVNYAIAVVNSISYKLSTDRKKVKVLVNIRYKGRSYAKREWNAYFLTTCKNNKTVENKQILAFVNS